MRILSVSDKVEPVLYGPYIRDRVGKVDLILACGDVPPYYLEYIVGLLDAPLYYVHGNHDKPPAEPSLLVAPAESGPGGFSWATDLHVRPRNYQGLLMGGLEGCRCYSPGAPFQYTEGDVRSQVFSLSLRLLWNRIRYGRRLDVLVTHAPPQGIHDDEDLPHRGFAGYLRALQKWRPLLMLHGHQHVYNRNAVTETDYHGTRIINTYGYRMIELEPVADRRVGWRLVRSSGQST